MHSVLLAVWKTMAPILLASYSHIYYSAVEIVSHSVFHRQHRSLDTWRAVTAYHSLCPCHYNNGADCVPNVQRSDRDRTGNSVGRCDGVASMCNHEASEEESEDRVCQVTTSEEGAGQATLVMMMTTTMMMKRKLR